MAYNKFITKDNEVLLDLTETTATADDVAVGKYFFGKDGVKVAGAANGAEVIAAHNEDTSAHADIREEISQLSSEIVDIKSDVSQLTPEFANDISECTDISKLYVLPDGYIYAYMKTKVWQDGSKNWVKYSTEANSTSIYNNGKGYEFGYRLNSSGARKEEPNSFAIGFIPVTKNSVLRIKYFGKGRTDGMGHTANHILLYNSSYTLLTTLQQGTGANMKANGVGVMDTDNKIFTVTASEILDNDNIAYMRLSTVINESPVEADGEKLIVTVDEEIKDGEYVDAYGWANTGKSFVSDDYLPRIIELENTDVNHESRLQMLEGASNDLSIPNYWNNEISTKADAIQQAMETAGRNKSAFLWYTDAHWPSNSKISPSLLNYLIKNTPMNKVNFGGDIIGDPNPHNHDNTKYVYEWRKMISNLPNHHSVYGNHDVNHRTTDVSKMAYAQIIAPEETPDMVVGGDSYYYIDNPSEKTRYLYLSYLSDTATRKSQGDFIADAISSVNDGWHIVVISHRWWQYNSASNPTDGYIMQYETEMLNMFDAYNARETYETTTFFNGWNFANAKGKVEFCIGGHIHVDYDFTSTGGIPVIITASDTNQERASGETEDCGTPGTITESAVYGIIADYSGEVTKITVVGVGRGTSRIVRKSTAQPTSIAKITYSGSTIVDANIDVSKFTFTVSYDDGTTMIVNGATSVNPIKISSVGNNTVTITYTDGDTTVSGTITIVGTEAVELFKKDDNDIHDTGRFNSSNGITDMSAGQLITGYIEAKVGDVFTVETDRALNSNAYTGDVVYYDTNKAVIGKMSREGHTYHSYSSDYLTGTYTVPSKYGSVSFANTAFVRFCVAYNSKDNIHITKS